MNQFKGETLSWEVKDGVIELALHRDPCNEIGSATIVDLEKFVAALESLEAKAHAVIIYSELKPGFCAGLHLRELYRRSKEMAHADALKGVRHHVERIHAGDECDSDAARRLPRSQPCMASPSAEGLNLAFTLDLTIADKMARFCFPELRAGLVPSFGGIPRLKRDLGNGVVRDLLLTGRSFNATKAQQVGLVSQVVGEGEALKAARATAAQLGKFDRATAAAAKKFIKPIPYEELKREIDLFCELFTQPAVEAGLRRFVESTDALPYLP